MLTRTYVTGQRGECDVFLHISIIILSEVRARERRHARSHARCEKHVVMVLIAITALYINFVTCLVFVYVYFSCVIKYYELIWSLSSLKYLIA